MRKSGSGSGTGVILALGLSMAGPANAQSGGNQLPPPPPGRTPVVMAGRAVPPGQCQIRVWSTVKIKSYVTGFAEAMGGAVGGALDGKRANAKSVEQLLRQALEGAPQATLLARLDLATTFGMPAVVIVPDPEATDPRKWKSAKGRMSEGAGACYSEIIVRDMYFLKTALFPPTVRVNFTFRDFRGGRAKPLVVEGRGGVKLPVYPGVTTADESVIVRAFQDAYLGAFEEFVTEQKTKGLR